MEAVVLHRVGFLAYFCPKQGQDFKPSAAPLYPNMGQVPPPGPVRFDQNGMDFATEISLCKTPVVDEKMLILQ